MKCNKIMVWLVACLMVMCSLTNAYALEVDGNQAVEERVVVENAIITDEQLLLARAIANVDEIA